MTGILDALRDSGLTCYSPSSSPPTILENEEEASDIKLDYQPFERPKPKDSQIAVQDALPEDPSLFNYFMDGSMRTINAGYVRDPKERFLPIFLAQVGVGATKLDGKRIGVEDFTSKNILFLPDAFRKYDEHTMRARVADVAHSSSQKLDVDLKCYSVELDTEPIDEARKQILAEMHKLETDLIKSYAKSNKVSRDCLLIIDGSLQFYENLEHDKEAFHNVVGVSKSFKLNRQIGSGTRSRRVGTYVAELRPRHRTPAHKIHIQRVNLTVGAWYMRLRSPTQNSDSFSTDGVVKIELFPDDATGTEPALDTNRCNRISRHILALRHPATPSTDSRWASHLYPIYLTERYIKSRFRSDITMNAIL